jgi:hypothetical protein
MCGWIGNGWFYANTVFSQLELTVAVLTAEQPSPARTAGMPNRPLHLPQKYKSSPYLPHPSSQLCDMPIRADHLASGFCGYTTVFFKPLKENN